VNAKRDFSLVGDQTVAASELSIVRNRLIDYGDLVAMNLLRREQGPVANSNLVAILAMNGVQTLERFGFVCRDIDARNADDESVANIRNPCERSEMFYSKLL